MTMIERLARAICCGGVCMRQKSDGTFPMPCDAILHRDEAHAALDALRPWLQHTEDCSIGIHGNECTCGLRSAKGE